ncbi:MAG: D-alanine--D-alanine ligase, partial [Acidimicrobiia bacterium]|nr:D-alanine--D-alanine ligase [Acidimicrobiia bacterium]
MTEPRTHLVVLYGGQSAEHDVSCVTASHVLRAIDPARYRVTPIGISTDGEWAMADGARAALETGPAALPGKLDPHGTTVSPTAALAEATGAGEPVVVLPLLHGPMGEDGTV